MARKTRRAQMPSPPLTADQLHSDAVRRFAQLANRCHVGDSPLRVARYAVSRMAPGAWRSRLTRGARKVLLRALFAERLANIGLYLYVKGSV